MHVPDGFLDAKTIAAAGTLSAIGVGIALRSSRKTLPPARLPLMGVGAAFVFAAQMVNFPVIGGTSGHLIGAVLVSVLMGPTAAVLVMTSVLIVQCLLFADGGILALGANILNMAIIAPLTGFAVYAGVRKVLPGIRGIVAGAGFAGWCSTVAASIACAGELAVSGIAPWNTVVPAMANIHMLIGIGEALITMLIVAAIQRARPDLIPENGSIIVPQHPGTTGAYILVVASALALFISPFASSWPDGLEQVASTLGFGHAAVSSIGTPLLGEYQFPGLSSPMAATALAGVCGTFAAMLFAFVIARLIVPSGRKQ